MVLSIEARNNIVVAYYMQTSNLSITYKCDKHSSW